MQGCERGPFFVFFSLSRFFFMIFLFLSFFSVVLVFCFVKVMFRFGFWISIEENRKEITSLSRCEFQNDFQILETVTVFFFLSEGTTGINYSCKGKRPSISKTFLTDTKKDTQRPRDMHSLSLRIKTLVCGEIVARPKSITKKRERGSKRNSREEYSQHELTE